MDPHVSYSGWTWSDDHQNHYRVGYDRNGNAIYEWAPWSGSSDSTPAHYPYSDRPGPGWRDTASPASRSFSTSYSTPMPHDPSYPPSSDYPYGGRPTPTHSYGSYSTSSPSYSARPHPPPAQPYDTTPRYTTPGYGDRSQGCHLCGAERSEFKDCRFCSAGDHNRGCRLCGACSRHGRIDRDRRMRTAGIGDKLRGHIDHGNKGDMKDGDVVGEHGHEEPPPLGDYSYRYQQVPVDVGPYGHQYPIRS